MSATMSLKKGAAYLGIGYEAMCEHVREGRIRTVQFPGRKFSKITKEALDEFVARCQSGPIAGPIASESLLEVQVNKGQNLSLVKRTKERPYQWMEKHAAK
jgi:excisionase family DNA binding protein